MIDKLSKGALLIFVVVISNLLVIDVLPNQGMLGLVNGVTSNNNPILCLADFMIVSSIMFYNFGKTESFLYGYGKYQLLRHKKRKALITIILSKTFLTSLFASLLRATIYYLMIALKGYNSYISKGVLTNFIVLYAITLFLLSCLQVLVEITKSSLAGIICVLSYYVISVFAGGELISQNLCIPTFIMIPNFYMKTRTDTIIESTNTNYFLIYVLLISYAVVAIFMCRKAVLKKDIF